MLNKKVITVFGHNYYLLGKNHEGQKVWMQGPEWQCSWSWGGLYITTFTNNNCPEKSRDISSHSHFDSMFMNKNENARDLFKNYFKETTLTDSEIWELCDYMRSFYSLKSVAELFYNGYSYYTERAKIEALKNKDQWSFINKRWLPEVFKRIDLLLSPEKF